MAEFNVRVEYEVTPIRHIAVECPDCKKWFNGWEIVQEQYSLKDSCDINYVVFECPICGKEFGGYQNNDKPNIDEVGYPKVYEGCLKRKETWE